jgi:hypothetical protein
MMIPTRVLAWIALAIALIVLLLVTGVVHVNAAVNPCVSGGGVATIGNYNLQANEFNGQGGTYTACSNDGNPDFSISGSTVNVPNNGAPAGYPSIYAGCHWGTCTPGNPFPVDVSSVENGTVTTTDHTTVIGSGTWDDAYDIWFRGDGVENPPSNSASPSLEMMIWLDHLGPSPAGSDQHRTITANGTTWEVWSNATGTGGTVSYVAQSPADSVTNMDLAPFAADAVTHGYMTPSWIMTDVEAGFEIWSGGNGLDQTAFSVNVGSPVPVLCCGHVVSVAPTRATVAWSQTVSNTDNVVINGPGPINGHTGSTTNDQAVYSGLEAGHTYVVTVQPTVNGVPEGASGRITFVTPAA